MSGKMSEERVSTAPRRRTPAEAEQLVAEFEASGLSRREFCQRRGLNISTLDAYRKRQRRAQPDPSASQRWVAVEVGEARPPHTAAASGLAVVLAGGRRIDVGRGFDAGTLEQLLTLLERG